MGFLQRSRLRIKLKSRKWARTGSMAILVLFDLMSDGQYVDGFRTALVLLPLIPSPIPDFVVGIQDWYHQLHRPLLDQFLSIYNPTGAEPIPDTPLINHKVNEIFSVAPNSTYRLRFISMAAFSMFNIWIDDHNMTIIEVNLRLITG